MSMSNQLKNEINAKLAQQLEIPNASFQEKHTSLLDRTDAFEKQSKEQIVSTDDVAHVRCDIHILQDNHMDLSKELDICVNKLTGRVAKLEILEWTYVELRKDEVPAS